MIDCVNSVRRDEQKMRLMVRAVYYVGLSLVANRRPRMYCTQTSQ